MGRLFTSNKPDDLFVVRSGVLLIVFRLKRIFFTRIAPFSNFLSIKLPSPYKSSSFVVPSSTRFELQRNEVSHASDPDSESAAHLHSSAATSAQVPPCSELRRAGWPIEERSTTE